MKSLKTIFRILKSHYLLSFVVLALVASLILYFNSYHTAADWILAIGSLAITIPLAWDMVNTLKSGAYGIDILAITAIISSVALGQDWTAIIIGLMLTGGEALEDYAENHAKTELKSLLDNKPRLAHLINKKGDVEDIPVDKIKVGDKLSILPGEVVPVDCELLEGDSSFNEASITGESLPVDKTIGDQVFSGATNIDGSIVVKAVRVAADSQYAQIIKLVEAAASSESPFVRLADRYSIPFTVIAFLIAGSVWFVSGHAIRFLEVIVVATPCPLLLAAPIALISGMSRSAKHGIIVKNGAALERLAEVKAIAFDKTGTLTTGLAEVEKVKAFKPFTNETLVSYAAAVEQNSNHILAQGVIKYAKAKQIKFQAAKKVKEIAGHGLMGRIKNQEIVVGRWSLMDDAGVKLPKDFNPKQIKDTAMYVAVGGSLAGVITFSDKIRPEAKNLLKRLKQAGIKHVLLVTGDNQEVANQVAKKLGIDDVYANCLPADKMRAIEQDKYKPVAFVGDGVNDAPVLTISDVGIALGARGSTAASESADVVIMLDDVSKVASAIEISKRTFRIAKESILGGIIISIGLMIIFATGHFKPIYGALLQEGVDVIVIFNALRAHSAYQRRVDGDKEKLL
jgi:heavy metal translocating P-type ATPase